MATLTREWVEMAGDDLADTQGRVLWVEDGTLGHTCFMGTNDTVSSLLADYAAGYDAGNEPCEVRVRWHLYLDGQEVDCGEHSWPVAPAAPPG